MVRRQPRSAPTEIILESISDGVFTVDLEWRITSFNRAAEEITGIPRREAIGRPCSEVFRASLCEGACALRRTLVSGKPLVNQPCFIVDGDGRRIPISISTALLRDASGQVVGGAETFRDLTVVEELRRELEGRFQIGELVSHSPSMRRIFEILPAIAESDCAVLIEGETGTGKELLARAIHSASPRRRGPFVAVNCSAIPETLLEAELFGVRAGAFTGADRDREGRFAAAQAGTLLLDEIGELSTAVQVKLLRVLQERSYEPLGSNASLPTDARIIAATNRDLRELVRTGSFREDLFYRINVVRLELPPLRRRREDIPLLIEHFVSALNCRQGRHVSGVSPDAMALLMAHDWPGNVRELENAIEHAFVLCRGQRIEPRHLPDPLFRRVSRGADLAGRLRAAEAEAILEALRRNHGNRQAAARALGMHRATLFRKVRKLGVALPDEDGRHRG
ncbi:MAG TPA: sigma 54-interacting transcriptional regulator [Thermoanaerobaculaceae bacterium]|nr:sigma 54-interacting transcriptional regulator [Thermoanaerobaculaceae bacterium]HRS17021.1 sigma 54-interacting transcriptional regulator [Thermoanaerobaculaceae bacterium]